MTRTRTARKATDTFAVVTVAEAKAFFASPNLSGASSADVISNLSALYSWGRGCAAVMLDLSIAGWATYWPGDFYLWRRNDPVAGVRFDPANPTAAVWLRGLPGVSSVTDWPVAGLVFKAAR